MRHMLAITVCAPVVVAAAAPVSFEFDPAASGASGVFTVSADTDGTLIGDFDEATNPGGTQTRPGLFGGSGNNPIPVTIGIGASAALGTSPSGSFTLDADTDALTLAFGAFEADLLNGETVDSTLALSLLYETFRTVNPSGLFLGGIPLPIELEAGQLTTLTLAQSAPSAPGGLVPNGDGTFAFAAIIPVTLTLEGTTLGGAPLDPGPADLVLPIAGVYTPAGGGDAARVALSIDLAEFGQTFDTSALPPLPEIPFDLPTLTGETAGVLLSLAITGLSLEGSGSVAVVADAVPSGCNAADVAEPFGVLDLADLQQYIGLFTAGAAAADLLPPFEVLDLADLQAFVAAFVAGCP